MSDSEAPVTVVVADGQSAVREGLVLLLGTLAGITVAGEAADGDAAVDLVAATNPQVVLMDLNMPGCDGVTATRRITAEYPGTRVVVLTTYADDESIIGESRAASRTGRSPARCSSARRRSRPTSTGSSRRPARATACTRCATPTRTATPTQDRRVSFSAD